MVTRMISLRNRPEPETTTWPVDRDSLGVSTVGEENDFYGSASPELLLGLIQAC